MAPAIPASVAVLGLQAPASWSLPGGLDVEAFTARLPWWQALPLLLALIALVALLLGRLLALIPALTLRLARLLELLSRLRGLLLALLGELLWVDPALRRRRHGHRQSGSTTASPRGSGLGQRLLAPLLLPVDWLLSIGAGRLFRPDPRCEEKEERRSGESAGLSRRLRWAWGRHVNVQMLLSLLRLLLPRLWLPGGLWRRWVHPDSYAPDFPIRAMLWLSHHADVREVLGRPGSFAVIYGPRMRWVTLPLQPAPAADAEAEASEHGNFLLGMQDTPRYWRDISAMRLVFRREDGERCRLLAERTASAALERVLAARREREPDPGAPLRLDLPVDLVLPVLETLVSTYFGIPLPLRCEGLPDGRGPECVEVDHDHHWLESVFRHLFYDLNGEPSRPACAHDAPRLSSALRQIIRRRRLEIEAGQDPDRDDVLSRCLRLQQAGTPGMDDETLRVNLTGFLVGAMTPLINATCQVIDALLERPGELAGAREAACGRADDAPQRLRGFVMEALRFSPVDPVIYRWSSCDTWIGEGARRCAVPRGTLLMAWNSSAMFDPALLPAPWRFRPDRPEEAYLHWGHGQHSCAGAYLNMAVIPGMLAPLLRQRSLRRAPGAAGQPAKEPPDGITLRHFELLVTPAVTSPPEPGADASAPA